MLISSVNSAKFSFNAINLNCTANNTADNIIRRYAETGDIRIRNQLVRVYKSAIESHAASICKDKALIKDYIQDLYLALLTRIEDVKKDKLSPTNLLNDMLNEVKSNKSIFNNDMLRLDLILKRNNNI